MEAWIQRLPVFLQGLPPIQCRLEVHNKGRPPLGDCIDFFSGSQAIPAVTHMHSIARALLCSMILGRREGHTHPRWVPSSSVPSFVSGVHTAFCHFCQWSFQRQESHILWTLRECTVYLMSGTSNKCLCSQCRNNPRQKTTVALQRIPKRQGQEITRQVKGEAVSQTRFTRENRGELADCTHNWWYQGRLVRLSWTHNPSSGQNLESFGTTGRDLLMANSACAAPRKELVPKDFLRISQGCAESLGESQHLPPPLLVLWLLQWLGSRQKAGVFSLQHLALFPSRSAGLSPSSRPRS